MKASAMKEFRQDCVVEHEAVAEQKLADGEARLHYAHHYGVPFMKLEHVPDTRHREAPSNIGGRLLSAGGSHSNTKLAAAAQRRKLKKLRSDS